MMSGDTSWSFAPRDSELRAWQGTYSKEFSARFGDTEPWYVLFLQYPDHLLEGTNSTHLVVKDIDGSTIWWYQLRDAFSQTTTRVLAVMRKPMRRCNRVSSLPPIN